jgi:hypothetical protein
MFPAAPGPLTAATRGGAPPPPRDAFVAVRALPGGPAPGPLQARFARYRGELEAARSWLDGYRARIEGVDRRLAERGQALGVRAALGPAPPSLYRPGSYFASSTAWIVSRPISFSNCG